VSQPAAADDPSIPDSEWLYRRVPGSQAPFDGNRGQRWPSSAAMLPTTGEHDISVYLESVLVRDAIPTADVLEQHEGYWLARLTCVGPRVQGLVVVRDPVHDSERPLSCDPAHALLTQLPPGINARRRVARALVYDYDLEWVVAPPEDVPDVSQPD